MNTEFHKRFKVREAGQEAVRGRQQGAHRLQDEDGKRLTNQYSPEPREMFALLFFVAVTGCSDCRGLAGFCAHLLAHDCFLAFTPIHCVHLEVSSFLFSPPSFSVSLLSFNKFIETPPPTSNTQSNTSSALSHWLTVTSLVQSVESVH